MRLHILQHVLYEGPANILLWANKRHATITNTRFFESGWQLPDPEAIDVLLVLGGPMSVHDTSAYPWLHAEKSFIDVTIQSKKKVIGVCLGAQLAAAALGAKIKANKHKEIGWHPIVKVGEPEIFSSLPASLPVFHWHGDTFEMPKDAVQLARSNACENQAFLWNDQVLGLQFHLEVSPGHISSMLKYSAQDLEGGGDYVQTEAQIRKEFSHATPLPAMLEDMLTKFAAL